MTTKERTNFRRLTRRNIAIVSMGSKCAACGGTSNLEFDHIDPKSKTREIAQSWLLSEDKLSRELSKCQLLCKPCHIDKTLKDAGLAKAKHGSYTMYNIHCCRCDACRSCNAERSTKRKFKIQQRGRVSNLIRRFYSRQLILRIVQ